MLERYIETRYAHWTSTMRAEFMRGIRDLERRVEAKHFAGRTRTCSVCYQTYSAQGECPSCPADIFGGTP